MKSLVFLLFAINNLKPSVTSRPEIHRFPEGEEERGEEAQVLVESDLFQNGEGGHSRKYFLAFAHDRRVLVFLPALLLQKVRDRLDPDSAHSSRNLKLLLKVSHHFKASSL